MIQEDKSLMQQLDLIGINSEVFASLPDDFKEAMEAGVLTPLLCTRKEMQDGRILEMPMKLQVTTDRDGKKMLLVYPVLTNFNNEMQLSATAYSSLKNGDVLRFKDSYLQRDPQTNCVIKIHVNELSIEERLKDIEKVHDIELGSEQKNRIRNGQPVELNVGGETVTVGLDLKEPNHFKTLKGGLDDWEYQQKVDYDILHPEYLGVVKTDENRWEYQQIMLSERYPESLKEKPRQAQSAGMRRS